LRSELCIHRQEQLIATSFHGGDEQGGRNRTEWERVECRS